LELLGELKARKTGMEYLETVLSYLSRGTDKVDEEDMRRAEGAFPFTGGEIMPTIAKKWIEQGMTKGIRQGTLQMAMGNIIEILYDGGLGGYGFGN